MELERQQLPNSTLILVFGILSIVGCCCYGAVGLIFGIIAVVMANRTTEVYHSNPELYIGYTNVKSGKILGLIGIVLSAITVLAVLIAWFVFGSLDAIEAAARNMSEPEY